MRLAGTAMDQVRIGVGEQDDGLEGRKEVDLPGQPFLALSFMTDFL